MSVTRHLIVVVLGALLPLLLVAMALATLLVRSEREATDQALTALLGSLAILAALLIGAGLALRRARVIEQGQRASDTLLRASEERFRNIAHAMPAIVWVAGESGLEFTNLRWQELTGQPPEQALGRGWLQCVHPEDQARLAPQAARSRATGAPYEGDIRYRVRDGSYRWHAFRALLTSGAAGREAQWFGCAVDIHEAREAQQALKEAGARFRALMDQAPFSMQIFSPDGRTQRVNAAWSKRWGVTAEQIAGYNILADAQLENKGVLAYLRRAFEGEAVVIPPIRYDPRETRPDLVGPVDGARDVSAVAYPLKDEAGRVREVVLVHEDITDRRRVEIALQESEQKLRLLVDTIPQLAWMAQPDGHIFWYNRRWYEYTGTTEQAMAGWGWQSVHDPLVLPRVLERWKASIASGEPFEMVFPLKSAAGVFHSFLTRVSPLRDAEGRVLYWFGTNTDISEIKRMEDALRDADRRKDEFLATLAHELRNPLAPIVNALQILKMPAVDAALAQRTRAMMERQVQHLVRLVDDLLDMSRVVRGKIDLRKEVVDLAAIVARAVEIAQPFIDAKAHRLELAFTGQPLRVEGDAVRLVQIVGNLLTNSAKYTEPQGRITISAGAEGEQAVLSVEDNGIGIPAQILPHVFDAFVQGDQSGARAEGGLGIGLTLVKSLVELHRGTVEIQQGRGGGTRVTVRLPLARATGAQQLVDRNQGSSTAPAAAQRILVVDDNRDAADSLAALLRMQSHEVQVAYDGAAAIDAARENLPAYVFLDIGMPVMDGYETARRLRSVPGMQAATIVALTGWGQEADRRRSAGAGFDRHLVKPPDPEALLQILSN